MAKQTAANNSLLKLIKDAMNDKVYAKCLLLVNEGNSLGKLEQGEKNALAVCATFFDPSKDPLDCIKGLAHTVRQSREERAQEKPIDISKLSELETARYLIEVQESLKKKPRGGPDLLAVQFLAQRLYQLAPQYDYLSRAQWDYAKALVAKGGSV